MRSKTSWAVVFLGLWVAAGRAEAQKDEARGDKAPAKAVEPSTAAGHEAADDGGRHRAQLVAGVDGSCCAKIDRVGRRAGRSSGSATSRRRRRTTNRSSRTASGWRTSWASATRACRSTRRSWSARRPSRRCVGKGDGLRGLRRPLAGVRRRPRRGAAARPDRARSRSPTWSPSPTPTRRPSRSPAWSPGVPPESQFARRLAESGCRVIVPTLIDRTRRASATAAAKLTNREFLYRPAFELGRHLIGYEVQKVLAAVDWFAKEAGRATRRSASSARARAGCSRCTPAALDPRIDARASAATSTTAATSGSEPIDRNVFGLLEQFGDAELASAGRARGR